MAKKLMEDMKSKGVRITQILKKDVDPTFMEKKASKEILATKKVEAKKKEASSITDTAEKETELKTHVHVNQSEMAKRIYSSPRIKGKSGGIKKSYIVILAIVLLVGGIYWISDLFQNAHISIIAKRSSFTLDHVQLSASSNESTPIAFELMIVSNEEYKDVVLNESQNVSTKGKGVITLFNENSTKPQNLLIHTFLADEKGKTYQTDNAISIPGYKLDKDKNIIPGQVDADITAFLAGDAYNGTPEKLTITGFKGTAKEKKIYAKLKIPITGGAQGLVYALGPNEKGTITAFAQSTFKSNLLKKVTAEVPEGYILYPNAMEFSYHTDVDTLFPTKTAKVKTSGTISSIIINKSDLYHAIIKNQLSSVTENELKEISIPDLSSLAFNFTNKDQSIAKDIKSISFNITGTINAIWSPDISTLQSSVVGVPKGNLVPIFKSDPGIVSASARIFPPWQSHLPNDISKIHISVK